MTCKECLDSLNAYVDGELSADEAAAMRDHLATCDDCAAAHTRLVEGTMRLKGALMRYEAPDVLKARLRATLAKPEAAVAVARPAVSYFSTIRWQAVVAGAAIVAVLSSALTLSITQRGGPSGQSIHSELLSSHIRSLMPGHLTDIASNDQHNVKPWFNGRVDISPAVPRLDSLGFPLIGGRLDYIEGRTVPVIVYARRQHIINVYVMPTDAEYEAPVTAGSHGYNILHLSRNGEEFWIVSDLNRAELEGFARLFIEKSG